MKNASYYSPILYLAVAAVCVFVAPTDAPANTGDVSPAAKPRGDASAPAKTEGAPGVGAPEDPRLMRPVRLVDTEALKVTATTSTRMIRPTSEFPPDPVKTRKGDTVEPGSPMPGGYPIHQSPPPPGVHASDTLKVSAARNESESVMLLIKPKRDLADVNLTWETPQGPETPKPPAIRWRRAEYIEAPRFSEVYAIRGTIRGEMADPLVEAGPFDARADRNSVILLEARVDEDVASGTYTTQVNVTAAGDLRESFTLKVNVWDLTLPPSDLEVQAGGSYGIKNEASKRRYERMRRFGMTNLKYGALGIKPRHLGEGEVSIERGKQAYIEDAKYLIDELGYTVCLPPSLMSPGKKSTYAGVSHDSPHYEAAVEDYIGKMRRLYEAHGWDDNVVWYIDDETDPEHYPLLIRTAKAAKRAWPDLPILITTNEMPPELAEVIDIWVVPWHFFVTNPKDVHRWDELRGDGMTLWSYMNSLYTINAEWSLSAMRIFPVALAKYGYRGALWYRADVHKRGVNPWQKASAAMKSGQLGSAYFFYPPLKGEPAGALHSSLRWEAFREGIDEYRMMRLLEGRAEEALRALDPSERDWAGPGAQMRGWGSLMATGFRLQTYRRDGGFVPRFRQLLAHETMRMGERPYALVDFEPDRAMNLQHETLHLRGMVEPGTEVTINGEPIPVKDRGEAGIFVHNPALEPGRNRFSIQLVGPEGHAKTLHREVYYNPPEG